MDYKHIEKEEYYLQVVNRKQFSHILRHKIVVHSTIIDKPFLNPKFVRFKLDDPRKKEYYIDVKIRKIIRSEDNNVTFVFDNVIDYNNKNIHDEQDSE